MSTNYEKIIHQNLSEFFAQLPQYPEKILGAKRIGNSFHISSFAEKCCISPDMITLSDKPSFTPKAILISLYAIHANPRPMRLEPFKSFKDLPNSMPYQGAFAANSEKVLVPYVIKIREKQRTIKDIFGGHNGLSNMGGDFSFVIYPFPKIALCYIFYLPDEEFSASATCLFSANALSFMPLDGLADVAEYASWKIIELVS